MRSSAPSTIFTPASAVRDSEPLEPVRKVIESAEAATSNVEKIKRQVEARWKVFREYR